uniref:Uncharacterized protein n=1 Tax=Arundo donax TaxID=35708 RepID=A0A0A9AEY3_ARUDO
METTLANQFAGSRNKALLAHFNDYAAPTTMNHLSAVGDVLDHSDILSNKL